MINFDSTHIFVGYLKQLLSTFNLPTCRIYTKEYANYYAQNNKEDPRVLESFDTLGGNRLATRINYLRDGEIANYFLNDNTSYTECLWRKCSPAFYEKDKTIHGLTRTLSSPGSTYDTTTHEYLGDYLRFLRDYHNVDLMPLYNCFNNKMCNNLFYKSSDGDIPYLNFNSQDSNYHIYVIPVKLFSKYTIAIDCNQNIEMFCGLYNTKLDESERNQDLIKKTYVKVNGAIFSQPFIFDKLAVDNWAIDLAKTDRGTVAFKQLNNLSIITKWDIANREQDLKLFIKVPTSCKSSITILEGDYRNYNDRKYSQIKLKADGTPFDPYHDSPEAQKKVFWKYDQNHCALNFEYTRTLDQPFKPIGKLQLLAFNSKISYPFSDRLIEYLCGSAITPLDPIADNIKRAQKVMEYNRYYFKINGLWEDKMKKIIYDYMINSGPIEVSKAGKVLDKHRGLNPVRHGYHPKLGHTSKSTLYDVLGYVDKDAEKWYASWTKDKNNKLDIKDSIQNVDIYNGLFDI